MPTDRPATLAQLADAIGYLADRQDAAVEAVREAVLALRDGGRVVLNVKNHIRAGVEQPVAAATEQSTRSAELARVVGALEAGGRLTVVQNVLPSSTTTKNVVRNDRGQIAQIIEVAE